MHIKLAVVLFLLALSAILIACTEKVQHTDRPAQLPAPVTAQAVQGAVKLLGQWNGPEGTYLLVNGASGKYAITISNLDGPRTFQGSGSGDSIAFERDGVHYVLRATDGAATGMKWLADKKHCITIAPGEGYCRD